MIPESRKKLFKHFRQFSNPQINTCLRVEIEHDLSITKNINLPLSVLLLHSLAKSTLNVPEFCYRFDVDDQIYELKHLTVSHIIPHQTTGINFCRVDYEENIELFSQSILTERQRVSLMDKLNSSLNPNIDTVRISIMPWLDFESIEHPTYNVHRDCIPTFAVGKFKGEKKGKLSFPLSIRVHHGLVDALHIAQFIDQFTSYFSFLLKASSSRFGENKQQQIKENIQNKEFYSNKIF